MSKLTVEEFLDKIEWEDGLFEALTSYGLSTEDLEESAPESIKLALSSAIHKAKEAQAAFKTFYDVVADEGYEVF